MHVPLQTSVSSENQLTIGDFSAVAEKINCAFPFNSGPFHAETELKSALYDVFSDPDLSSFLVRVSRADVFSENAATTFSKSETHLPLLRVYKLLKYCYNLPCAQLTIQLANLIKSFYPKATHWDALALRVADDEYYRTLFLKHLVLDKAAPTSLKSLYDENATYLVENDPHAIYPTSIYRQCFGHVTSTPDSSMIEGVMGTTITTTIEIVRDVLNPASKQLRDIYKPLRRCVAIIDERVDNLYGEALTKYFNSHSILVEKLVYRCMEVDKDISTVETILVDLKKLRVSRNEPVLVVGGGVMADVGGFACALYHRNTPYVMLCTSIVSGIDAGPSPRTCCDGLGYKNVFGAYHPPVVTLTDRQMFGTLKTGWIRHGIAEIIKMAVTKDGTLFDAVEKAGNRLVETKFGIENCEVGSEIDQLSDTIIAKAMDGYVRSEYGNLWETHQCRPHAYGHTWSPGFELQAGLLHGHAVAIGMGYGAYLSYIEGWIKERELHRILRVISTVGLSLRHDILENVDSLWSAQVKMVEKRGGNLCAPVPKGAIGTCGYINDVDRDRLENTLRDYQELVKSYPRGGLGIEPHCKDVGLEDPSTVKQHAENAVPMRGDANPSVEPTNGHSTVQNGSETIENGEPNGSGNIETYNKWIKTAQEKRNDSEKKTSSTMGAQMIREVTEDTKNPPNFDQSSLFYPGAEEYALDMTSLSCSDFVDVATATTEAGLFAPCMVGKLEGQFLKMMAQIKGAERILDIGTFTGYSALAFAEGMGRTGEVLTLEADEATADVARKVFSKSRSGGKIKLIECDAFKEVEIMANKGEKFDIVFLDADKVNYKHYYEWGLQMLKHDGILMADNALCSLVYEKDDPAVQKLHEFAQFVRSDDRVEQVMLTVREGILVVRKI